MKYFFDQFITPKSVASCWVAAKQKKIVLFLCKASYGEGLDSIHKLTTIGGDRISPTVMNTAVIGVGIDEFISHVDSLSLCKNNLTTFFHPPWKNIKDATSIQTSFLFHLLFLLLRTIQRSSLETASTFPHLH